VAGIQQDMLALRAPARRTTTTATALDLPVVRGGSRQRPQRRQGHSRRRAGGETKRLPHQWAGPPTQSRSSPC